MCFKFVNYNLDTAQVNNHITEPSLHLTLGVDSLIWGLTYADLRARSLEQVAIKDKLLATKLSPNIFFELHVSKFFIDWFFIANLTIPLHIVSITTRIPFKWNRPKSFFYERIFGKTNPTSGTIKIHQCQ